MKKACVLCFFFCVLQLQAVSEVKSIAVENFESATYSISRSESESITELYIAELIETGKVNVVDRALSNKIFGNSRMQDSDWADAKKTIALGKALGAQLISRGKIMKLGSLFYLSATLIDVKTAKAVSSSRIEFSSIEEVPFLLAEFAETAVAGLSFKIGDIGLGGGFIFYIEGDKVLECSEILGEGNWNEAKEMCKKYRGGGYDDWYLPTKDELSYVYNNLRKTGKIAGDDWYWSASRFNTYYAWGQLFSMGHQGCDDIEKPNAVRAIRAFNLNSD